MKSKSAREVAQIYLEKYKTSESEFGLGPFLESGAYTLYANVEALKNGSMRLSIDGGNYCDCRTIALRMYNSIREEHAELQPQIAIFNKRETHNWVEIIDPKSKEIIQIDSTPWYATLNPGHIRTFIDNTLSISTV